MGFDFHFSSLISKMSKLCLAISYLTTSNLPLLMDLIFQVPMQYCSLQYQTLLLSPVTSTTGCCFPFGSASSFLLELFLYFSPQNTILGTYRPGEFIVQCHIFLPFHNVHGFLKARMLKWFANPFSSGPCFVRVGSQEIPRVTGKFVLQVQNEAGQRLTEFCQENTLVIATNLFQQHKR